MIYMLLKSNRAPLKCLIFKIFIFLLLISNLHQVMAEDKNSNWKPTVLFLLGGQSNMDGRGTTTEIPKEFSKYPASVRMWANDNWVELKPGEMFGPEIGFAFEMAKKLPRVQIGLIKLGSSGTDMTLWAGNDAESKDKKSKPNGTLYLSWIKMLEKAQKSAPEAKLSGVLWMQGESDATKQELADKYKANLTKLIEGVREESGNNTIPFLIGKIQSKEFKFVKTVWKAEIDVSKEIPKVILVNTDEVELKPDKIHFTSKGQLELGKLFAEEYLKSLSKSKGSSVRK